LGYKGPPVANSPSFVNVALADPDDFGVNKGTIIGKNANKYATFFITGALTSIGKGQVCVVPDTSLG